MTKNTETVDSGLCPLCNQDNRCGNIASCDNKAICWCSSPEINFTDALLKQIPKDAKGKACVCKRCALAILK